ncbi:hypothetical protein, partial [Corynebacterium matruchotii]|uniref:hypothetical protein n=1 Tax=Corynebacterium matruchotii TaxID=43768 RepID=UPI003C789CFA
ILLPGERKTPVQKTNDTSATGHIKQKPSLELMQLVKQGFRFSLGSSWQLRFTQEETSRKSEPKLSTYAAQP